MVNKKRLIDANALICDIQNNWDYASADGITATTVLKQTITDIRNQPTVDAVPVVRCKDCQSGCKTWFEDKAVNYCRRIGREIKPNFFCAYGERRTDYADD